MRLGNFSVEIPRGNYLDSGYVAMKHNTKYTIRLCNFGDLRCDAEVEIDGKPVGAWRVPSNGRIVIERPVHDTGCFTFYKIGTGEAKKAELVCSEKLGLITVLFKPEKKVKVNRSSPQILRMCRQRMKAGGTGLTGKSEQEFHTVQPLDYDETKFVQINLRLVCETDEPRPLTPVSTPIPPLL